ncbi:hypothetical protein LJR225_003851 [Phenylobacterium sp. LjRoot225]|uniref:hypothetical protein n=1 Tax=Phenylobacterium sp. LjRoot225 TaxID=3342285 RepID=UPI003ECCDDE6
MFENLRIGLSWLRSAVAWWVVEVVLSTYQRLGGVCSKLRRPHAISDVTKTS